VLRRAGVVVKGFGGLYAISPPFRAGIGPGGTFDLGHCLLRLTPPLG